MNKTGPKFEEDILKHKNKKEKRKKDNEEVEETNKDKLEEEYKTIFDHF